ncbi:MAG TPA: restriction endonuclease [Candidatus Syntrophoarchaeum butanivorans]|uniref:Restriction endonuclease n=1 Tax=Candidatus Syntropharchaeum butanivorans TaxID=1839936 RepID=A0A7C0X2T0_9EURY|nr:MAG: restriction endonuclease [Candidatus Syntrophoarchaeum sp. WYZ-LMO15]HDM36271.1 restriction endonuclease [Candidatus Syntrophoarchaeum butanivorans]
MSLWMVRAGKHGEQEAVALNENVVTIGWNELPDLSGVSTKDELEELYWRTYPDAKKMQAVNEIGQIWRFIHEIKKGDLVALPLKTQSAVAIGRVEGDYKYKELAENVKHIRSVKWLKTIARSAFDQDLLYSLGAFMTVCGIKRNNAEERIKVLLEKEATTEPVDTFPEEEVIDIETYAKDQITKYIGRKFKGHNLARLVDAILKAQGYTTKVSSPGPDGGVDILASGGPLGFDHPRICIQVKSSSSPVDVRILRELRGVMSKVKSDQGLLVSWAGFTNRAIQEARDDFFTIRLWDSGDLLDAIFKYYEKFDDELKAELPLKRIWALVLEDE